MIGRIVRSADFERVLGRPSRARSAHFAVHHLALAPSQPRWHGRVVAELPPGLSPDSGELSTGDAQAFPKAVDDSPPAALEGAWLGAVVPKRMAKRAVTRNLVKRQIRAVFAGVSHLPPGLWVVRLRAPLDRKLFPSAASDALRTVLRVELNQLVARFAASAP